MLRIAVNLYQQADFLALDNLALGFRFANRSAVSQALDNLDRSVFVLHLRHENGHIVSIPSPEPRHHLPNHIHDLAAATD
jgi:ABC-type branched-subunit amino acid transport system ATPase component